MALRQCRKLLRCSGSRNVENLIQALSIKEMHNHSSSLQLSFFELADSTGLCGALSARLPPLQPQLRWFRSTPALQLDVEIQSMGESISEGTIAEILKAEGDSVAEDETIAQIETDKVTVDVKAPAAGTLTELKVNVDDTVKTGQVVAVISEGAGEDSKPKKAGAAKPSPSQNDEAHSKEEGGQEGSKPSPAKEESSHTQATGNEEQEPEGRKPSIKFPERMRGGKRISQMSEEERSKIGGDSTQPSTKQVPAAKAAKESQPQKPIWYVGKEQGTKLSQSQVLSQKEMEQIELGGAEP